MLHKRLVSDGVVAVVGKGMCGGKMCETVRNKAEAAVCHTFDHKDIVLEGTLVLYYPIATHDDG